MARSEPERGQEDGGAQAAIEVGTDGSLLIINLTSADISDNAGALMILDAIRKRSPWIKHLFADGAYSDRDIAE
ncbi:putative transposase domain protein [Brucella lupini]|uniref:Transposase n=1 Tax=Brucella lupini TaxID=255457 RepID=A0A256H0I8_9HYPH|nr:transposase [Brucella lupini]OYR32975.1 putative transposase domain protein [Brucella lupini]